MHVGPTTPRKVAVSNRLHPARQPRAFSLFFMSFFIPTQKRPPSLRWDSDASPQLASIDPYESSRESTPLPGEYASGPEFSESAARRLWRCEVPGEQTSSQPVDCSAVIRTVQFLLVRYAVLRRSISGFDKTFGVVSRQQSGSCRHIFQQNAVSYRPIAYLFYVFCDVALLAD